MQWGEMGQGETQVNSNKVLIQILLASDAHTNFGINVIPAYVYLHATICAR